MFDTIVCRRCDRVVHGNYLRDGICHPCRTAEAIGFQEPLRRRLERIEDKLEKVTRELDEATMKAAEAGGGD